MRSPAEHVPPAGDLLVRTSSGLFCPDGGFHIDPWEPVESAIVTHAHADHARPGSRRYLTAREGEAVARVRLPGAEIDSLPYGEARHVGGVTVSLHPAGHVLGSAQIRIERRGEVWVVSGDYKLDRDPTCRGFEPVVCHRFISESTFGLPVYRWPDPARELARLRAWRRRCREEGRFAVLATYALGKAQRVLASLEADDEPILAHGAIRPLIEAYRAAGVSLPEVLPATREQAERHRGRALVLAPPSAVDAAWIRAFTPASVAAASGWMLVRGIRRRRRVDEAFVISDHADWPGLLAAIDATRCESATLTHGFAAPLAAHLRASGLDAGTVATRFGDDADSGEAIADPSSEPATITPSLDPPLFDDEARP
ncbi:MAG: ligase-associated DNA damage response exonuclease [Phycisphaerales bacterium]